MYKNKIYVIVEKTYPYYLDEKGNYVEEVSEAHHMKTLDEVMSFVDALNKDSKRVIDSTWFEIMEFHSVIAYEFIKSIEEW